MPPAAQAFTVKSVESVLDSARYNKAILLSHQYDSNKRKNNHLTAFSRGDRFHHQPSSFLNPTKSSIKKLKDHRKRKDRQPKRNIHFNDYDESKSSMRCAWRLQCDQAVFMLFLVCGEVTVQQQILHPGSPKISHGNPTHQRPFSSRDF